MADDTKKKKKKEGDRTFRRLDEQESPTAPLPVAWAFGLGLGSLGGLAAMVWDVAVLERARIPVLPELTTEALLPWVVGHAALGGALGLLGGSTGLIGVRWSTATVITLYGWLLGPILVAVAQGVGLPGVVGLAASVALAGLVGQGLGRLPFPAFAHAMVAAVGFASAVVLVPLHEHLLSASLTAGAIGVTAVTMMFALPYAAGCAVMARDARPPLLSLLALLVLGGGAATAFHREAAPPPPVGGAGPTVVFVGVDGLRTTDLPALPQLQQLARRSASFEQARSTSNWVVPALGSALTGRWPYGHQAGLHDGQNPGTRPLDPRVVTLADTLRRQEFATIGVTSDPSLRTFGLDHGFDQWLDQPARGAGPAFAAPLVAAGVVPRTFGGTTATAEVVDRAIAALAASERGATFLLVHLSELRGGRGDAASFDAELARLVAATPSDAWLVVFGTFGRAGTDPRQSVENKGTDGMFDDWIRVPLLVRGAQVPARRVDRMVSLVDLFATVLELVGGRQPGEAALGDGAVLAEVLGSEGVVDRMILAQSTGRGPEQQAILKWPHKLVRSGLDTALYDLVTDPGEREPLAITPALDPLERSLEAALPVDGAPIVEGGLPPSVVQVGQAGTRIWGSGR